MSLTFAAQNIRANNKQANYKTICGFANLYPLRILIITDHQPPNTVCTMYAAVQQAKFRQI